MGDAARADAAAAMAPALHAPGRGQDAKELSEGSDDEDSTRPGDRAASILEETLPEEPWMSHPSWERELWERARPRALRREAAQVRGLRLPAANIGRIMKLNPTLQVRSAEALEVINYATVLVMQAVARAAARGKSGQRVQFEDIKQTCATMHELQFLHPLPGTLDSSAMTLRSDGVDAPAPEQEGAAGGATTSKPRGAGQRPAPAVGPGQMMLNASVFARNAATDGGHEPAVEAVEVGPASKSEGRTSMKRRPPASAQTGGHKVPRKCKVPEATASGIMRFLIRT